MDSREFEKTLDVPRETIEKLEVYEATLRKWQKAINLVGPKTVLAVWERHFLDSAQLFALAPVPQRHGTWLDFGSGAGFPGLVIALLGAEHVHLVESDGRKCAFLREVIRRTDAAATVHAARAEKLDPFPVDVVTARALAPMAQLLDLAYPFWDAKTVGLFPKGRDVEEELTEASKYWTMEPELLSSQTQGDARIVRLSSVRRRTGEAK